jgi:hypothetical protein
MSSATSSARTPVSLDASAVLPLKNEKNPDTRERGEKKLEKRDLSSRHYIVIAKFNSGSHVVWKLTGAVSAGGPAALFLLDCVFVYEPVQRACTY